MNKLVFLDIETLPAGDPVDPLTLKPPGNLKKAESIAEWHRTEASVLAEKAFRDRALDSMQGRILCVGWSYGGEQDVILEADEQSTLQKFSSLVEGITGPWRQIPTFVGWNINAFDLPWIWRKAVRYGFKPLRDAITRDRYKANSIDLMLTWAADYRDFRKLADVAAFLGLEGKNGMDGSQVYGLYLEGRFEEIKNYCAADVETVRQIYNRIFG